MIDELLQAEGSLRSRRPSLQLYWDGRHKKSITKELKSQDYLTELRCHLLPQQYWDWRESLLWGPEPGHAAPTCS